MPHNKPSIFLLASALVALSGLTLLSGCKGNPTSAAMLGKAVTPPPTMTAMPAAGNPAQADPLVDLPWVGAGFAPFVSPLNTDRSTPPARAAVLYDATTLFVAFVCDTANATPGGDAVSLFLDSTPAGSGQNVVQISVSHDGQSHVTFRNTPTPPTPRSDGTPDLNYPLSQQPDYQVAGLSTKVRDGQEHGHKVWTAVVAIPIRQLPPALRITPQPGARWKVNLLRTVSTLLAGGQQTLQSNLSPVFVGAQPVSPYRMAELYLSPGTMTAAR